MPQTTVLLVNWAGAYGGAEKYQLNIVRAFDHDRYRFLFASPTGEWSQRLAEAGFAHFPVAMRPGLDVQSVLRLRRIIGDERVDIVHAQQSRGLLQAGLAAKLAGRAAVVQTEHNMSLGWYRGGVFPWYVRWINNPMRSVVACLLADRIITLGQSGKDFYTKILHFPANRLAIIPVPHPVFPERPAPANPAPVIGVVAELTERKGLAHLIEAAPAVLECYPGAQFLIIGRGHLEDHLRHLITQRGLQDNVRLLGFVPNVAERMSEWDMLALPSLWDPFPQVILEAMANGLPVVASAVDGALEMVVNNETGLLVAPADPPALAAAILRLLDDRALARRMGRQGRERLARVYNLAGVVQQIDRLYQAIHPSEGSEPSEGSGSARTGGSRR
jgi:glycosyltransferase involved in cell wall biosynthesis